MQYPSNRTLLSRHVHTTMHLIKTRNNERGKGNVLHKYNGKGRELCALVKTRSYGRCSTRACRTCNSRPGSRKGHHFTRVNESLINIIRVSARGRHRWGINPEAIYRDISASSLSHTLSYLPMKFD